MNTITIEYDNSDYKKAYPSVQVRTFLKKVLKKLGFDNVEFSVSFIDENHMHELNLQYRNIDRSTDILSFAVEDSDDGFDFVVADEIQKRNIGDMLICPEVMKENARLFGVSEAEELNRLLIHGVLHLSGENHTSNDASEPMLIHQEQILREIL